MIYVDVGGRCGNQLFEYAFAKSLQKLQKDDILFNTFIIDNHTNEDFWEFALDRFVLSPYKKESVENGCVFKYGNTIQRIVYNLYYKSFEKKKKKYNDVNIWKWRLKVQIVLNRFGIYDIGQGYYKIRKSFFNNKFVSGPFEDKRYFNRFRDELLKEIKPKKNTSSSLLNIIQNNESVCVTVRRGDFFSKELKGTYAVCDRNYYYRAIDLIKKRFTNAQFIFFSDDLDWVRKEFKNVENALYEPNGLSIDNKLLCMSSCKHFILSNSTFSWWAQYLSTNNTKTVVSPKKWFNMEDFTHPLIDDSWILI